MDDFLEGHPRYKQVRRPGGATACAAHVCCGRSRPSRQAALLVQIRFLNRGAYGFVILALDNQTGEQVALKFIKRGPQHITKYVDREVRWPALAGQVKLALGAVQVGFPVCGCTPICICTADSQPHAVTAPAHHRLTRGEPARNVRQPRPLRLRSTEACRLPLSSAAGATQVFLTKTHLVLAMEYAAGGDLFRYVSARRGLPEDEARWFFQQLMVAVDYCHRMVRSCTSWSSDLAALAPDGASHSLASGAADMVFAGRHQPGH